MAGFEPRDEYRKKEKAPYQPGGMHLPAGIQAGIQSMVTPPAQGTYGVYAKQTLPAAGSPIGTPEADQQRTNQQSQVQQTPSAMAAKPEAPKVGFGIQGMNAGPGQGVAQFAGGRRYEVQGDQVQNVTGGVQQPMRGGVSYVGQDQTADTMMKERLHREGMARLQAGGSYDAPQQQAPQMMDPNQLAQQQFNRMKEEADNAMFNLTNPRSLEQLTPEYKAAMAGRVQALTGQLGAANNAGLAAGGGIAQQQIQAGAENNRTAGLKSYWDGQLGVQRGQLDLQKQVATQAANRPPKQDIRTISNEYVIPGSRPDKSGKQQTVKLEQPMINGVPQATPQQIALANDEAGIRARMEAEEAGGPFGIKNLIGMGMDDEEIAARQAELLPQFAARFGYGINR